MSYREVPRVVQAGSDLRLVQVRQLGDDLLRFFSRREVSENQANRNSDSLEARFYSEDVRCTYDLVSPSGIHDNARFLRSLQPSALLPGLILFGSSLTTLSPRVDSNFLRSSQI